MKSCIRCLSILIAVAVFALVQGAWACGGSCKKTTPVVEKGDASKEAAGKVAEKDQAKPVEGDQKKKETEKKDGEKA